MIFALIAFTSIGILAAIYNIVVDSKRGKKSSHENTENLSLADKVNSLQGEVDHFKKRALESESLFDALQDKINHAEAQKANVEKQVRELTDAKSKQADLMAQMEQQKDDLITELNQIKTTDNQTRDRIEKAEQQAAELKEELYKEREENQKLRKKIDESSKITEKLSDEKRKLIERIELLQKQINVLIEEKNEQAEKEQSKSFNDAQAQKKSFQKQIRKKDEVQSECKSLNEKNQSLSSETEKIKDYKNAPKQQNHYSDYLIKKDTLDQKDDLSSPINPISEDKAPEANKEQLEKSIKNRGIKTKRIGRICIERGLVTSEVLDNALKHHKKLKVSLIHYLISHGHLRETDLAQCLSSQFGVPFLSMESCEISAETIKYVPYEIAEKYQLLPIDKVGDMLSVIMIDPTDIEAIHAVVSSSHCSVNVFVGLTSEIAKAIKYNYSSTIEVLKKEYQGP